MSIESLFRRFLRFVRSLMSIDKRVSQLFKCQDDAVVLPL